MWGFGEGHRENIPIILGRRDGEILTDGTPGPGSHDYNLGNVLKLMGRGMNKQPHAKHQFQTTSSPLWNSVALALSYAYSILWVHQSNQIEQSQSPSLCSCLWLYCPSAWKYLLPPTPCTPNELLLIQNLHDYCSYYQTRVLRNGEKLRILKVQYEDTIKSWCERNKTQEQLLKFFVWASKRTEILFMEMRKNRGKKSRVQFWTSLGCLLNLQMEIPSKQKETQIYNHRTAMS